jgi:hypothetical protein
MNPWNYPSLRSPCPAVERRSLAEPPDWLGFPPALLPISISESGIMSGFWWHWFTPPRRNSIVEFFGQTQFGRYLISMEVARTFSQFIYITLLRELSLKGHPTNEITSLALKANVDELPQLVDIANRTGDDLSQLLELGLFSENPPHSCFEDDTFYPGDFPHLGFEETPQALQFACGYEIHSRFGNGKPDPAGYRSYVASLQASPPWLSAVDQRPVFESLLNDGNVSTSWLCLNSIGWSFKDARIAITELANKVNDDRFSQFAALWSNQEHERRMGDWY